MGGRKRASTGMQMSLVQKLDMYCKVPEWAREFLPDIDKPWKQKGPYGCRRLEPSGWNCHLCGCEGSSSHVFGMPHLTKCYWDKYPDGHEALEDSSDKAQEPGPILAIEDRSPGASPSAAPTASSVACALPNGEGFSSAFLRWWSHREHVKDEADASEQAQLQRAMMKDEQHDDEDDEKPRRDTRRGRSRHRSRSQRRQFRQHHQFQATTMMRMDMVQLHDLQLRGTNEGEKRRCLRLINGAGQQMWNLPVRPEVRQTVRLF